ncbi:hypothetical protein AKO1_012126 [Acrasis kona]|uniref:60S ribosomal protein L11 n=1 Tax=Acrasis kona TaxID=1008807 RepID=A0AAW2ZBU3_9EUKA
MKYDPSLIVKGIFGMDFYVVLGRAGRRVSQRKRCRSRVGVQHKVTKEEAKRWFQDEMKGILLN